MVSIDVFEEMLQNIAESLPAVFFENLNGGILLLPEYRYHPKAVAEDLYVMGEYHHTSVYGRYITIFYGSFSRVYGHLSQEDLYKKLEHTVKHEFRHHLESQGGIRDLEIWDRERILEYERGAIRIQSSIR